ncbi:MLP-like protein 28, partial [Mucuna pruriens]
MVLKGKVVTELGIRSPAAKFFNGYAKQLHNLPNIIDTLHEGNLHEGDDWHDIGAVKSWTLTTGGKVETLKESIEAIDEQNNSISFKIFDGEVSKDYKMFKIHLQVIDKEEGGAVTVWTIEYEKMNEDIKPPYHFMDIITAATKDVDDHSLRQFSRMLKGSWRWIFERKYGKILELMEIEVQSGALMALMVLKGKVVTELGIRSPAAKFFNGYAKQIHNLPNIIDTLHEGNLHEGDDWHDIGAVKSWTLTTGGKVETLKESIEAIDEQNNSISFKVFDGEVSKDYKMFKVHLQVIDKEEGGAVTVWTIEYEKMNEDIKPPYHFLDFITAATKDVDDHVLKA